MVVSIEIEEGRTISLVHDNIVLYVEGEAFTRWDRRQRAVAED